MDGSEVRPDGSGDGDAFDDPAGAPLDPVGIADRLRHLPERKQRELLHVVRVLFERVLSHTSGHLNRSNDRILKVILYGSFARGDWVDDRSSGYQSDFDLLVVVNRQGMAEEDELWIGLEEHFIKELIGGRLTTPVVPIVHAYQDINNQLSMGRPFFVDIARDGIVLYEEAGHPLAQPKLLDPLAAKEEAQRHYERWSQSAHQRFELAKEAMRRGYLNDAAFDLHQTTERLYHCALLVLTLYSPKSHRIKTLRSAAERLEPKLIEAWPRDSRFSRRCFEQLARSYVEARYSPGFAISKEELDWLQGRVEKLEQIVGTVCQKYLSTART